MTKKIQWLVAASRQTKSVGAALLRPQDARRAHLESADQRFEQNTLALRGAYMALLSGFER